MTWTFDLRRVRRAIERNVLLKIFSVVFALGLWAFVNLGARDAEKTLSVPIELRNVPPELIVVSTVVEAVDVRIRGPRTILGTIDERRMKLPLNLGNARPGAVSFNIDAEMLGLPRGVRVTRLSPVRIDLRVDRQVRRTVPVVLDPETVVPDGYRFVTTEIRPRLISISGPADDLKDVQSVVTAPLTLRHAASGFEESVAVRLPSNLVQAVPERVVVRGRLEEIIVTREYRQVEIGVRQQKERSVRLNPARGDVTLRGPTRILQAFQPGADTVYVDVEAVGGGTHKIKVETELPEGIEIVRVDPERVSVEVGSPGRRAP